jgi:hypothetical protein
MSKAKEIELTGAKRKRFRTGAYPNVELGNSTLYTVDFTVKYAACSTDTQTVASMKTGAPLSRGLCLLTAVYATVHTPGGNTPATPYTSSGTSYSQFCCIFYKGNYVVTRVEW